MSLHETSKKLIRRIAAPAALAFVALCSAQADNVPQTSTPANASGDLREEFVEDPIFGGRIYLQQRGLKNAPVVVFVHGLGDNGARDWDKINLALSRRYHTIAFDLPGFGRSDKGDEIYSPKNYAKFVNWIIMTYAKQPVILMGHSMGGAIALYMAAEHPERVERLVLVDAAGILHRSTLLKFLVSFPSGSTENDNAGRNGSGISTWLARAIERSEIISRRLGGVIDETRIRRLFIDDTPMTIAGAELMETNFSPLISKVTAPTLVVWGERDRIAPLRTGQVLAEWLTRARLVTIADAGHVPMTESPARTREAIEAFLSAPDAAPRAASPTPEINDSAPKLKCQDERDKHYTGTYSTIDIERCANVTLTNVAARAIVVKDSTVSLVNARVVSPATAITVDASEFNATNLRVNAEVALQTSNSRLDLAGAEIVGTRYAIANEQPGAIVCSLCTLRSGANELKWHDVYGLAANTNY